MIETDYWLNVENQLKMCKTNLMTIEIAYLKVFWFTGSKLIQFGIAFLSVIIQGWPLKS